MDGWVDGCHNTILLLCRIHPTTNGRDAWAVHQHDAICTLHFPLSHLQPKGIGLDASGRMQIWFHGMISREESEKLLAAQPIGQLHPLPSASNLFFFEYLWIVLMNDDAYLFKDRIVMVDVTVIAGAFLVRVSTRIFGYTLSFVDKDRFKVGSEHYIYELGSWIDANRSIA